MDNKTDKECCAFCGRVGEYELLGRRICSSCWDMVATISLKAIQAVFVQHLSEQIVRVLDKSIRLIEQGE